MSCSSSCCYKSKVCEQLSVSKKASGCLRLPHLIRHTSHVTSLTSLQTLRVTSRDTLQGVLRRARVQVSQSGRVQSGAVRGNRHAAEDLAR